MNNNIFDNMPLLAKEIAAFELYLQSHFTSGSYMDKLSLAQIKGGGKRIRPALVISCAMLGDYKRAEVFPLAAAIETIHTATLLHDDVIDQADTRRGKPSFHMQNGNHIAIYTGDFLLARALRMLAQCDLPQENLEQLLYALEEICSGDVAQYLGRGSIPGYRTYLRRIVGKTGILFAAACAGGAYKGQLDAKTQKQLWHFGIRLGTAFQIRDDLLDIEAEENATGKPTERDLLDGIVTLPFILAARREGFRRKLEDFLAGNNAEFSADQLLLQVKQTEAVKKTKEILKRNLERCQNILRTTIRDSEAKLYLWQIVDFMQM